MRYMLIGSVAVALALAMAGPARANLITNGDFDTFVPRNGTGGGWTSSNIDDVGGWESSGGNPDAFFGLNEGGDVNTDPTIEQTLSGLNVGQTYTVSGDYKVNILAQFGTADSFEVLLDGSPILTLDDPGATGVWGAFSTSFVATATSHTVGFAGETNGTDTDYGVDNIVVVPEPASLTLIAIGAWAMLRRRSRSSGGRKAS